jgi:pyrroline-5-carboxylate reductase
MTATEQRRTINLGIVGGGFMGEAILRGLLQVGVVRPEGVSIGEPVAARRAYLGDAFPGARIADDGAGVASGSQLLLLAVKPQDFPTAAAALRGVLAADQLVLSIMAGVRLQSLREQLGHERVVRAMPNTPASVGEGFTAWMPSDAAGDADREVVRRVLGAVGREVEVHEERYIDMITAIGGSGPGYVFLFIEALIDASVHIGVPRALAAEAVLQTVLGSAKMAMSDGRHPAQLRNMVTSAGGTTAAGLQVLERSAMRATLTEAVIAAYEKSRALGG